MSLMKVTLVFCLLTSLSACQSTGSSYAHKQITPTNLFNDQAYPEFRSVKIEDKVSIFALSEEMKQLVEDSLLPERDTQKRATKLIKHIFDNESIGLAYQSNANLIASDAYHNRQANCMSLTIMAYALAKEAGLNIKFQDVQIPEYWVRNGQYNMLTGHVNLVLVDVKAPNVSVVWGGTSLEIDFDPFVRKKSFPKEKIGIDTVVSMYYNNKGAQALVAEDYTTAYAYFRAAIESDPNYAASWGNLGILYKFDHQWDLAEQAYRHSIALAPNSLNTLTNLSILLTANGDYDEARRIDSAIIKQRIKNPYYHALLADEAFYAGEPQRAIRYYKRALKLNSGIHEFYFGMAKIYSAMGDFDSAKYAMQKAISKTKTPNVEKQYLAKLNILNQH